MVKLEKYNNTLLALYITGNGKTRQLKYITAWKIFTSPACSTTHQCHKTGFFWALACSMPVHFH